MPEEVLGELPKPLEPGRAASGRARPRAREERARGVDRRELELLLGAEVGEEAALAHPDRVGQAADREAVDALDRGEPGGLVEDRLRLRSPSLRVLRTGLGLRSVSVSLIRLDKLARPVVHCAQ